MKVLRVIEYDGPEDWVKKVLAKSIKGRYPVGIGIITELPREIVPEPAQG